jgi:hypothetical protein
MKAIKGASMAASPWEMSGMAKEAGPANSRLIACLDKIVRRRTTFPPTTAACAERRLALASTSLKISSQRPTE